MKRRRGATNEILEMRLFRAPRVKNITIDPMPVKNPTQIHQNHKKQ